MKSNLIREGIIYKAFEQYVVLRGFANRGYFRKDGFVSKGLY
jgi:hypothetical protein